MLSIGTKPEYFNAVWVKNEWSRFLKMVKNDRSKMLIPCYKGMDAYELPEEFAHLQAQDMSKIGFINDIVRGIKKIINKQTESNAIQGTITTTANTNITPLLERAFIFLEDGEWNRADEYCEKVLDIDPKCAKAYIGKLMVDMGVEIQDDLRKCRESFESNSNYQKALRFADPALKRTLESYLETIRDSKFKHLMNSAIPADGCKDITSSSNQSGTVTFYGFKKRLPVMSAVSIQINGIDIGTVSRGETLSWNFTGNANVDLRYCGDFNWRRNALSLTPGVTNVQLEYGARTLVSKKW